MQKEAPNEKDNFDENNQDHVDFLLGVFDRLNELFTLCNVQWCECEYQNELDYIRDSRIRFELEDIYYHRDDLGYINGNGTYQNLYCYNNYGICKDEVLNVFFCQPAISTSGYGPQTHIMMLNQYGEYLDGNENPWGAGNLLGHEVGHVFGLSHSWGSGKFSDMCQAEDNPSWCYDRDTDCTCGNNVMSYSRLNDFFSPLQMAHMHRHLMNSSVSKYLKLEDNLGTITISEPTVWDKIQVIESEVKIEPGASLTIECKTLMAPNVRIVVKRGARLIVDGATITTNGPTQTVCNSETKRERWTGIEVWGNTAQENTVEMLSESYNLQTTDPGVVILKNGALIENAQVGIFPQQRATEWSEQLEHFGGLVSATGVTFRNCWKTAEFISFESIQNSSRFTNCTITQLFLGTTVSNPVTAYFGVTNWQVGGIQFNQCTFNNLAAGLYVLNADLHVTGSAFNINDHAIYTGMSSPMVDTRATIGGASAARNTFKYCYRAVVGLSHSDIRIWNNLMEDCPLGVAIEGTSTYEIIGNEFRNSNTSGTPDLVTGILVRQTGTGRRSMIECNLWNAVGTPLIRDGIIAIGDNGATYFRDNTFDSWYDVRLNRATDKSGNTVTPGRFPWQGDLLNAIYNDFTDFGIGTHHAEIHTPHRDLEHTEHFRYHQPSGTCGTSQLIPRRPYQGTCAVTTNPIYYFENQIAAGDQAVCDPIFDDDILDEGECRTPACLEDYYNDISDQDNLIDAGDDALLYSGIANSPNSGPLLAALSAASPYLSDGVMLALMGSSMTSSNMLNILSGNIPLSPYILSVASVSLTTGDYTTLVNLHDPEMTSERDSVRALRLSLSNIKNALLWHLVDSLIQEKDYEDADDLLAADPDRFARETRIGLKMQIGDSASIAQLLSTYPTTLADDADFKFIQLLNLGFQFAGTLPSSSDSTDLLGVAEGYGKQAGYAKVLAGILYGMTFDPEVPDPEEEEEYQVFRPDGPVTANDLHPDFEIYPNPTEGTLYIVVPAGEEYHKMHLRIFSSDGRLVSSYELFSGTNTLGVEKFPHGIYVLSFVRDGSIVFNRSLIKGSK